MRETQILRGLHKARATLHMQSGGRIPLTDDIVGPRRPQTVNVDAGNLTTQARAQAAARTAPPIGNTVNATLPPVQETAPAPKSAWQQAKQWGGNQWDAARGRPTQGVAAAPAAPARPSVVKPVLGGLAAGAMGGAAGYAAAQAATGIGDPSNKPVRVNPTETEQVLKIPGQGRAAPTPQPYNYFTDNETGRNVGNTLNAVSMIPGAGPVARGALGLGAGAISKTLKLAERPLVAGAVQGAAQGVRDVNIESAAPTQAAAQSKVVDAAPASVSVPTVAPTPTANGRQYIPGTVTPEDHAESDRLLNSVRGKWGSDSNDRSLRAGALDTVNKAWAMRGDGIKATMDPRGNGQLVFSNSTAPEKMPYVDTKGAPTADYKQTRQFAESSAGLRAQQPMNLEMRKQLLAEQRYATELEDKRAATATANLKDGRAALVDAIKRDRNSFVPNDNGGSDFDGKRAGEIEQYISRTNPTVPYGGRNMSLQELYAHAPDKADEIRQRASDEFSMREFANAYSKGGLFGKGTDAGALVVKTPPRDIERLQDAIHNNTHMLDAVWGGQVIEFGGQGGKSVAIPIKEILAQPNGREMLDAALERYRDDMAEAQRRKSAK